MFYYKRSPVLFSTSSIKKRRKLTLKERKIKLIEDQARTHLGIVFDLRSKSVLEDIKDYQIDNECIKFCEQIYNPKFQDSNVEQTFKKLV